MKLKALYLTLAAASMIPNAVYAAGDGLNPTTITDGFTLRFAGASAEDNLIFDTMLKDICASNISVLSNAPITSNPPKVGNFFGVACTAKVTNATNKIDINISGKNIMLLKRSAGGSAFGVNTLLENPPRPVTQLDPSTCVLTGTYTHPTIASIGTVDAYTCSNLAPGLEVAADAGVSDVDPPLFTSINTPAGFSPVVAAQVTKKFGTVKGVVAQVFGVVASTNLRNNLQTAQFGAGSPCVGSDTEACMPSMSKELLASLFTGRTTQWNQIQVPTSGGASTEFTSLPGIQLPTPVGGTFPVKICRRVPGSGTQATINNVIMNAGCGHGLAPLTGNTSSVVQGSGSGDAINCLKAWNSATPQTIATDIGAGTFTVNPNSQSGWAIGVMGLEKADSNFKFIKIDGIAPTTKNAHDGKYQMWAEATIQYRTDSASGFALAGLKLGFVSTIKSLVGTASSLATLNSLFPQPAYLALSTVSGNVPDAVYQDSNPVIAFTHTTTNTDNCRIPAMNATYRNKTPGF